MKTFIGDFETTVFENQDYTEVWASALVEIYTEDVKIFHSIDDTFEYLKNINEKVIVYYHNLKFDGHFWLYYLMEKLKFKQAFDEELKEFYDDKNMKNNTFKYIISDMGQWYSLTIKIKGKIIEIRDSLKLLPFSVKKIGTSFQTKHKKLDIEYEGYRYAGCKITEEEKSYIANDVLVIKEALEIMFNEGHNQLTIGSCCLEEFKKKYDGKDYESMFPDLEKISLDKNVFGSENVDEYIRNSYKGGWCYVVPQKTNRIFNNGITADVNSLYPSVMSGESGNIYPIGKPTFWKGNKIPHIIKASKNIYYFIRIKTRFYLRKNKLPCIQIKRNLLYKSNVWLDRSDIYDKTTGKYYRYYTDTDNQKKLAYVILTLTCTDYELIKEHYILQDFEILDGCYFCGEAGIFDEYINKYKQIKISSTGAKRELAKLFLNNLYGKMASSKNSSFKYAYEKEEGVIAFTEITQFNKKIGYIPIGSAITSYARNFTIRTAQKNYFGADKRGFIYADTDSIHCDLSAKELQGINVDDNEFLCWKLEATWDKGIFVRQKTYIEHVIEENLQPCKSHFNIKCAGMPEYCKQLFEFSMLSKPKEWWESENNIYKKEWNDMEQIEQDFVVQPRKLEDFKIGLIIPGKLIPKKIKGGIILAGTTYEMR